MNQMINWNFAPKTTSRSKNKEYELSVYYYPNKKSPGYAIQVHTEAPTRIREADVVTFGKLNNILVITDSDKGASYRVHKYENTSSVQINGKDLCKSIVDHFGLNNKTNQILRLKLNPIGDVNMRLWSIRLHNYDSK